jgi:hypothetical protein
MVEDARHRGTNVVAARLSRPREGAAGADQKDSTEHAALRGMFRRFGRQSALPVGF